MGTSRSPVAISGSEQPHQQHAGLVIAGRLHEASPTSSATDPRPHRRWPQPRQKSKGGTWDGPLWHSAKRPRAAARRARRCWNWPTATTAAYPSCAAPRGSREQPYGLGFQKMQRRFAVAFRDGSDLFLWLWIKRASKGDIYYFIPTGRTGRKWERWNPHRSHHASGQRHHKSFNHPFFVE